MINELGEPEGHQLLPWPVCSHPDVGLLRSKPQRRWPRQPGTCRSGNYSSHPSGRQNALASSAQGFSTFSVPPSRDIGKFIKIQIPGSGANLIPSLVLCLGGDAKNRHFFKQAALMLL